jgi:hypothetical protein
MLFFELFPAVVTIVALWAAIALFIANQQADSHDE